MSYPTAIRGQMMGCGEAHLLTSRRAIDPNEAVWRERDWWIWVIGLRLEIPGVENVADRQMILVLWTP